MNYKMIIHTTGQILGVGALCLLASAGISLIYAETEGLWLLISALIAGILYCITRRFKPKDNIFFAKEGLVTVALAWLILSLVGALPFYLSGEIPSYVDSLFETISGLTTTGATVLDDPQVLSHGNIFWRSLCHWIGGMGVLVLLVALLPQASGRAIHMLRAEMPGPVVGKLVPKAKQTARILYIIYIFLTIIEFFFLIFDMPIFDSAIHALSTAGTGGFGVLADSIASYSPYCQWVIAIFMFIFAINFNLFFFMLIGKFKLSFKSEEFWAFFGIVVIATFAIAFNVMDRYSSFSESIRHSAFQVSSYVSTTGFATTDANAWPTFSKAILLLLMFLGGCAGSTAGGLKVSRFIILLKATHSRIRRVLYPRSVKAVRVEGKSLDDDTLTAVLSYFSIYVFCFISLFLVLSLEPFSMETTFSSSVSIFNNIGPIFGDLANFGAYSPFSKIIMSFAMLLGRLEIYPMLILFMPATWKK